MGILGFGADAIDKVALSSEENGEHLKELPLSAIELGCFQPRLLAIDDDNIEALSQSIAELGVLQPVIVRKKDHDRYELIAGERRLKACQLLGKTTIPAMVTMANPKEAFTYAVVENVQRHQLNVLEEGAALRRLRDEYGLSNDEVAKKISKPRTTVTNLMRLDERLCAQGKQWLLGGKIEYGHARAVLALDEKSQEFLLRELIRCRWSVRRLEAAVKQETQATLTVEQTTLEDVSLQKRRILQALKTVVKGCFEVSIAASTRKTKVTIEFTTPDEAMAFIEAQKINATDKDE